MMEEYNKQNQQEVLITIVHFMEACVAEWLTPQTPDLEVWGSSLAHRVVSLDKNFTPLCLSSPRCISEYWPHTAGG